MEKYFEAMKPAFDALIQWAIDGIRTQMADSIQYRRASLTPQQINIFRERMAAIDKLRYKPEEWPEWLMKSVQERVTERLTKLTLL